MQKFEMFHNDGLFNESLPLMDELRCEGTFCDVTLKVEDQSFSAHRIILAGAIPYFRAMFTSNMAESRMEEITIKEIEPSALESLISYAYTATVQIDKQNAQNLLAGASFLQLDKVRDACSDFLTSHLDPHDVLGLRQWGDSLGCNNLVQAADTYINRHFSEIAESPEFLLLTSDQLTEIIKREELEVPTEEIVFEACLRWVKYKRKERSEHFPAVFSGVRLPMLSPEFLVDNVFKEELVETSPECRKLVQEAVVYHLLPGRRPQLRSFRTQARDEQLFIIGQEQGQVTVDTLDPLTGQLTRGPSIGVSTIRYMNGAKVGAKVYLFGNDVLIYDFKAKKWSNRGNFSLSPSYPAVTALNGYIYLCGGNSYYQPSKTVRRFCAKSGICTRVGRMLQGRSSATAISLGKFVYVLGGNTGSGVSSSVERYDPLRNTWTNVKSMLNARKQFGAATLNGKLYACGGHDGYSNLHSVEVYDPKMDTWNSLAPMNQRRHNFALISYANKLWAIGGSVKTELLSWIEVYDPETNKWAFEMPFKAHRGWTTAYVISA